MKKKGIYHILALGVTIVWGTTFVSTKILLNNGLTPAIIFVIRFLMAYILAWIFGSRKISAATLKDEALLLLLGMSGGSIYFLMENTALEYTLASNVSLIICTAPLITAFLSHACIKGERITRRLILGSSLAMIGIFFVIYNGHFILEINPAGDLLTLGAATSWGFYTIILKQLDAKYPPMFIIRKIFFYGIITMIPFLLATDTKIPPAIFSTIVIANIIFLGTIASMLCYFLWNIAVKQLGAIRTTNYIYLTPLVTFVTSVIVLHERITPVAILGAAFILAGVYIAEKRKNNSLEK
jgi:drug/metabolite transporter (DMT)-like permease